MVEIEVVVQVTTDKAVLVHLFDFDDEEIWIPFSVIEDNGEDTVKGYEGSIYVQEWFAKKNGLA